MRTNLSPLIILAPNVFLFFFFFFAGRLVVWTKTFFFERSLKAYLQFDLPDIHRMDCSGHIPDNLGVFSFSCYRVMKWLVTFYISCRQSKQDIQVHQISHSFYCTFWLAYHLFHNRYTSLFFYYYWYFPIENVDLLQESQRSYEGFIREWNNTLKHAILFHHCLDAR